MRVYAVLPVQSHRPWPDSLQLKHDSNQCVCTSLCQGQALGGRLKGRGNFRPGRMRPFPPGSGRSENKVERRTPQQVEDGQFKVIAPALIAKNVSYCSNFLLTTSRGHAI
jgi:hypothetical protein